MTANAWKYVPPYAILVFSLTHIIDLAVPLMFEIKAKV